MTNEDFLSSLASLEDFQGLAELERFTPIPDHWFLFCCDITNSTKAIEEGRYKAVNMIGAACIMAAINAAGETEIGYVFGGDGATIVVPASLAGKVSEALDKTRYLSRHTFQLELRVGYVSVDAIRQQGKELLVAMLELSPGNRAALFAGGGAQLAESLIKNDTSGQYRLREKATEPPDLEGLSCRWEPLAAQHGTMMCMLISAQANDVSERAKIYGDIIAKIERILRPDLDSARPVRAENMPV